ncbi:MAG: C40 family peptidase [candidate division Zixibacteria bacterium]|nr:C40 family peptidase [candidate division Zixibacteria bacterium]
MYKALFLIVTYFILSGCQGTPRYGGGHHTDEGTRSNSKPQNDTRQINTYAVDPIVMGRIIDKYLGKPYAGQSKERKGYDCSEFIGLVYSEYSSMHLPRTTEKLWKTGKRIEKSKLYFGDLVFFDTGGRGVSHVGIYVGFDEFVHASLSNGIIISNINDKYYHKRYLGARRMME